MASPDLPLVLLTNAIDPAGAAILQPHARLIVAPDSSAATLRRIPVSYVPGANAVAVAECCFAATIVLGRRLTETG